MFAAASFAHSAVPTLVINSALDSWQMGNVLKLTHGPHKGCTAPGYAVCTAEEVGILNGWAADFLSDLRVRARLARSFYARFAQQREAAMDGATHGRGRGTDLNAHAAADRAARATRLRATPSSWRAASSTSASSGRRSSIGAAQGSPCPNINTSK